MNAGYIFQLGTFQGDSPLNGKSAWKGRGRPIDWPFQSSILTDQIRRLSRDIISDEWKNISSEAIKPFIFTLPLEKYVPAKGGQPIRAMVRFSNDKYAT